MYMLYHIAQHDKVELRMVGPVVYVLRQECKSVFMRMLGEKSASILYLLGIDIYAHASEATVDEGFEVASFTAAYLQNAQTVTQRKDFLNERNNISLGGQSLLVEI